MPLMGVLLIFVGCGVFEVLVACSLVSLVLLDLVVATLWVGF